MLPLQVRVDLEVIAMKWYFASPKSPALMEPHHQIVLCQYQDTRLGGELINTIPGNAWGDHGNNGPVK